jgi:TRAP-type mannitol/chloroaromatic compound transport system permease small subunit
MVIFNNIVARFCATLLLLMTLLGVGNALLRYYSKFAGTALSSNAFLELQWYLFSAIFLVGAGYTLQQNRHVRVDVLYGRLSENSKRWIDLIGTALFLIPFCLFGIWASWEFVFNSWAILEMSSDSGGLPRYPVKSLIPICFVLLLFQALVGLTEQISHIRKKTDE